LKNKISQFKKSVLKKFGKDQILSAIAETQAKILAEGVNADPKLHLQLATLYFLNLDYVPAVASVDQYLTTDAKNVNANFLKGQSLSYIENFDAAMKAFLVAFVRRYFLWGKEHFILIM
jgi:Flp pilus assembly protein TadD